MGRGEWRKSGEWWSRLHLASGAAASGCGTWCASLAVAVHLSDDISVRVCEQVLHATRLPRA